jgi:signal transduction histidine kinase
MQNSLLDTLVGVSLGLVGLAIWHRRRPAPAVLLLTSAALWFAGGAVESLALAHRGPSTHFLVGYPRGRLARSSERLVVAVGYAAALAYPIGRSAVATLALAASVIAVTLRGYLRSRGVERRARLIGLTASAAVWGVLCVGAGARLAGRPLDPQVLVAYEVTLIAVAIAVFVDVRYVRWSRSAITSLAVDLGQAGPRSLRDLLAGALGDPSLVLAYPDPRSGLLSDETGRPVAIGPNPPDRAITELRDDAGRRIAVLVHDAAVLDDPVLVASVAALTRVALANARLQAQVADRLAEVAASRRRLITVADTERARLDAELRGVQRRLERVAALLAVPSSDGAGLARHLAASQDAIREFAHGVHPRVLTDHGLAVALRDLACRTPVPVTVDVPDLRFGSDLEAAAYFVCAEALTNIAKYAGARKASIRVSDTGGELTVEISDDGVGGAEPSPGSGLTGLGDRLDVLGGRVDVDSPPGRGTRLTARIPLPRR